MLDKAVIGRIDRIVSLKNQGREADTYLHHLMVASEESDDGWTIFAQGDPFTHSPDFIKLLGQRNQWNDIQPLTWGWKQDSQIPPQFLMDKERNEWLENSRVRSQLYSTWTLEMHGWIDPGSRSMMPHYLHHNKLASGYNIAAHFLERCGLNELAEEAWAASTGRFAFGAMLAVRNTRLGFLPSEVLPKMKQLAREFYVNGYIFERLWLHFFGLPFVEADVKPPMRKLKPMPSAK